MDAICVKRSKTGVLWNALVASHSVYGLRRGSVRSAPEGTAARAAAAPQAARVCGSLPDALLGHAAEAAAARGLRRGVTGSAAIMRMPVRLAASS